MANLLTLTEWMQSRPTRPTVTGVPGVWVEVGGSCIWWLMPDRGTAYKLGTHPETGVELGYSTNKNEQRRFDSLEEVMQFVEEG